MPAEFHEYALIRAERDKSSSFETLRTNTCGICTPVPGISGTAVRAV